MKQKRVTSSTCEFQDCGKLFDVAPKGPVPRFCPEHAGAGRVAKHRSKIAPAKRARTQRYRNEKHSRENPETFTIYHPSNLTLHLLRTARVVPLPTSENSNHTQLAFIEPVKIAQPSIIIECGRASVKDDSQLYTLTPIEQAARSDIEDYTKRIGITEEPDPFWLAKLCEANGRSDSKGMQLSLLTEREQGLTEVDGVDEDDWWRDQISVAEELEEDGSEATIAESGDLLIEEDQEEDDTEPVVDNSETPEDKSYQLATSVHLRLAQWWKSHHENEEPLNLRLFLHGLRQDGPYSRTAPGGSRLDFSHRGQQVRSPIIGLCLSDFSYRGSHLPPLTGPCLSDGSFYPIDDFQPMHNFGRSCPCDDCVLSRTPVGRMVDSLMGDVYGRIRQGTELLRNGTEVRYLSNWTLMRCGDEFRYVNLNYELAKAFPQQCVIGKGKWRHEGTVGEKLWKFGGLNITAEHENPPNVVHDKYEFNPVCGTCVLRQRLIRQRDIDVSIKWPAHLLFAAQDQWFDRMERYTQDDRRMHHPSSEFLMGGTVEVHVPERRHLKFGPQTYENFCGRKPKPTVVNLLDLGQWDAEESPITFCDKPECHAHHKMKETCEAARFRIRSNFWR